MRRPARRRAARAARFPGASGRAERRLRVDDDDEWALCKVEKRWAGKVHLLRQRHQRGTSPKIELMDSEFAKLPPAIVEGLNQLTPDLIELEVVEEYTMLHTLRERYEADMIYTSIGPVLVSINPYKPIDSCSQKALGKFFAENACPKTCAS